MWEPVEHNICIVHQNAFKQTIQFRPKAYKLNTRSVALTKTHSQNGGILLFFSKLTLYHELKKKHKIDLSIFILNLKI